VDEGRDRAAVRLNVEGLPRESQLAAPGASKVHRQGTSASLVHLTTVWRHAALGSLTLAVFGLHLALALRLWSSYRLGSYDLVIFDQAVRGYADLTVPVSPLKGVHDGFGRDFSVLGDHFSPVLALLAPIYWVWDDPRALLAAQALLFASAVPLVWVFTRRELGTAPAWLAAAAFGLSFGLQQATAVGFHEIAFAVPLIALALERVQAGRPGQALGAAAALLLVKEDMGLVVAGLAVVFAARGHVRHAALAALLGISGLALANLVFVPLAGGDPGFYWTYSVLGDDAGTALKTVFTHPWSVLFSLVDHEIKRDTLQSLLLVAAGACLLSPIAVLAVGPVAERMLSDHGFYWMKEFHYDAPLMVVAFMAGAEGIARLQRALQRRVPRASFVGPAWAVAVFVVAVLSCRAYALWQLAESPPLTDERRYAAAQALQLIPGDAVVEADNFLGPHLTARTRVLMVDETPRGADWVAVDRWLLDWPFFSIQARQARLDLLDRNGYRKVFDRQGYLVYHRPAATG
jgi:uncharacterized membrane protein